ncbi:MAG: prephenate dehydrogenase [Geodermatophilaceae bacterium]
MSERIAVVGLGLIGGSLSLRLSGSNDVVGYDADPGTRDLARAAGIAVTDGLAAAVDGASVVFVAVPLSALSTVVGQVTAAATEGAVVTDVGSVKSPLYAALRAARLGVRYVGGHPMAGTERSGFAASDPGLYDGAAWVLCLEPDTDLSAWLRLATILTGIGARVVPSTAADHDAAVARVSHVPHLLAAALAAAAAEAGALSLTLAAGSFRDGTRVAATAPELPTAMCRANHDAVSTALGDVVGRLMTAQDDFGPLIANGHAARLAWYNRQARPAEIPIGGHMLPDRLLDLGRHGGWLEQVGPETLSTMTPEPV